MSLSLTDQSFPGINPVYTGQNAYHWTAAEGRCLALPGAQARLFSVSINRALAGLVVYVYDGWSVSGTLVAKIDGSTKGLYNFGGVRTPNGIFIDVVGTGTFDVTATMESAEPRQGALTLSGNEVTDAGRLAATQGDGRALSGTLTVSGNELTAGTRQQTLTTASSGQMMDQYPVNRANDNFLESSFGIHRAAANLFRRGQCDAATDSTATGGGTTTTAVDATTPAPFSPQSISVSPDGTAANQGVHAVSATGLAAAAATVGVGSIYFKGVAGQSYQYAVRWTYTDTTTTEGSTQNVTATGSWQLLTATSLAVAVGKTGDKLGIRVYVLGTRAETFNVAHAMLESGRPYVAPYVATNGGATAGHSQSRVQANPGSLGINSTQGWMVTRMRMGYPSTGTGLAVGVADLNDGTTNNRVGYVWNDAASNWQTRRVSGGVGGTAALVSDTFSSGDFRTVILRWDATTIALSVGGASFVSANANQTFSQTNIDIGSVGTGSQIESDIFWFACGTGTLTDADAALINGFGNTDPGIHAFPTTAQTVAFWSAHDATYLNRADSSMGVWEATTNSWTNGGFESNTTGWAGVGTVAATIAQEATHVKFGSQALKVTTSGGAVGEGASTTNATKVTAASGQTWTVSEWVWAPAGATLTLSIRGLDNVNAGTESFDVAFVGKGDWQRVTNTATFAVGATVGFTARITTTTAAQAISYWLDGVQFEQKSVATPYVETNGAAASRSASRVQIPSSSLSATQGWIAIRLRFGQATGSLSDSVNGSSAFSWFFSGNPLLDLRYGAASNFWVLRRRDDAGVSGTTPSVADTFATGDQRTLVSAWDSSNLKVSIGAAFTSVAQSNIPSSNPSTALDVGSLNGSSRFIDSDVLWVAWGTGTLTDADAAMINSWGSLDPLPSWFPTAASCTMVWHGNGTQYLTP